MGMGMGMGAAGRADTEMLFKLESNLTGWGVYQSIYLPVYLNYQSQTGPARHLSPHGTHDDDKLN